MNYMDVALAHAAKKYPVFPVKPDKTPFVKNWEQMATTNPDLIRLWWGRWPNALPGVCPGRVHRVVIDVDRHPGRPDGMRTLMDYGININDAVPRFKSLSGHGWHFWYRGDVRSRNGLYPGIDRKAQGGYVIATYDLPTLMEARIALPVPFHGKTQFDVGQQHPYNGSPREWLAAISDHTMSPAVRKTLEQIAHPFTGHENMLRVQTRLVHLGREGHGGVSRAIYEAERDWLNADHASKEDPSREWDTALATAISKFGGAL